MSSNPTWSANDLGHRRQRLPICRFRRQLRAIRGIGSDPLPEIPVVGALSRPASLVEHFDGRLRDALAALPTVGFWSTLPTKMRAAICRRLALRGFKNGERGTGGPLLLERSRIGGAALSNPKAAAS